MISKSASGVLISILLIGCGGPATQAGKPSFKTEDLAGIGSGRVLVAVCNKIVKCQKTILQDYCMKTAADVSTISDQMGIKAGTYTTYGDIMFAEQSQTIKANSDATSRCELSISYLDCTDPRVQNAYDPNSKVPFSNISNMISKDQCGGMFSGS